MNIINKDTPQNIYRKFFNVLEFPSEVLSNADGSALQYVVILRMVRYAIETVFNA
jgi:hypothetical protein